MPGRKLDTIMELQLNPTYLMVPAVPEALNNALNQQSTDYRSQFLARNGNDPLQRTSSNPKVLPITKQQMIEATLPYLPQVIHRRIVRRQDISIYK